MSERINHLKATVQEPDDGVRIIKWILRHYRHIVQSKESCKRAFKRGEITVNGQVVPETRLLHTNDVVEVKFDKGLVERQKLMAVNVDIRYQDEHVAVVWKAAGQSFGVFERALQYKCSEVEQDVKLRFLYTLQKAASGLLVVAKSELAKNILGELYSEDKVNLTVRVICHGRVPADLLSTIDQEKQQETAGLVDEIDSDDDEIAADIPATQRTGNIVKSIHIAETTRSNAADYLTTLDLDVCTPFSSTAIRSFFFHRTSYPIVGNSTYTKQLKASKDKGLCMSIIRVCLEHPATRKTMVFEAQEPEKFQLLRTREQKFWRRNFNRELEELKKAGVNTAAAAEYLDSIETAEGSKKKPLAYVLGKKEFCGHTFKVTESCLIPRPSSETLVEATTKYLNSTTTTNENGTTMRVLDIGTGCGNLLLSILHRLPNATGVGLDISQQALQVAQENAQCLNIADDRVSWTHQDMKCYAVPGDERLFDVIVCNPPYLDLIAIQHRSEHRPMLDHEPSIALFAKDEGYEWYTVLSEIAPKLLQPKGWLILECGKGMMKRVKLIFQGWKVVEVLKDRQGWDRCLVLNME